MVYGDIIAVVRQKVKTFTPDNDDLDFSVMETEQAIKNYCNISEVPEELKYVWANMATDLLRYTHEVNTKPEDVVESFDPSDVQTINIGDTSVTFGDKYRSNQRSRTLQSHQAKLDDLTMDYKGQLNQFRRIR